MRSHPRTLDGASLRGGDERVTHEAANEGGGGDLLWPGGLGVPAPCSPTRPLMPGALKLYSGTRLRVNSFLLLVNGLAGANRLSDC